MPVKECHLPVLQHTAVQGQKLNSGLSNSAGKTSRISSLPAFLNSYPYSSALSFFPHRWWCPFLPLPNSHITAPSPPPFPHPVFLQCSWLSNSVFSPEDTVSFLVEENSDAFNRLQGPPLQISFKVSIQQNMQSRGKGRNGGKSLCPGLLMSYELQNTAGFKTSHCSPSNKGEGICLGDECKPSQSTD